MNRLAVAVTIMFMTAFFALPAYAQADRWGLSPADWSSLPSDQILQRARVSYQEVDQVDIGFALILGNDPSARVLLGFALDAGVAGSRDPVRAAEEYRLAAVAGHPRGMNAYGSALAVGRGVARDLVAAAQWYRRSAEAGNAYGMHNYGVSLLWGNGVTMNRTAGAQWIGRAAEAGSAWAMSDYGRLFHQGLGVTQNDRLAAQWFRRGAEAGNAGAMSDYGYALGTGRGVTRDVAQARVWYRRAIAAAERSGDTVTRRLARSNLAALDSGQEDGAAGMMETWRRQQDARQQEEYRNDAGDAAQRRYEQGNP